EERRSCIDLQCSLLSDAIGLGPERTGAYDRVCELYSSPCRFPSCDRPSSRCNHHATNTSRSIGTVFRTNCYVSLRSISCCARSSQQRKLIVQDDPERRQHTVAALGDVGIAESELQPWDPRDIPDDVQVALTNSRQSDPIPPLGVAHEQRNSRNVDTGKQRPRAEIVSGGDAPRFLARLIEIVLLKREIA